MLNTDTLLIIISVPLLLSAACWFLFAGPLRRVITLLCYDQRSEAKNIGSVFWERIYLALTLLIPLFVVLLLTPTLVSFSPANSLLFALRWSLFGGIALILTLAWLVRKQMLLNHKYPVPTAQEIAKTEAQL